MAPLNPSQAESGNESTEQTPIINTITVRTIMTDPSTGELIEYDMPVYISVIPRPCPPSPLADTAPTPQHIPVWRPSTRPHAAWTPQSQPSENTSWRGNVFGSSWAAGRTTPGSAPRERARLYSGGNWRGQSTNRGRGNSHHIVPGTENRYACLTDLNDSKNSSSESDSGSQPSIDINRVDTGCEQAPHDDSGGQNIINNQDEPAQSTPASQTGNSVTVCQTNNPPT